MSESFDEIEILKIMNQKCCSYSAARQDFLKWKQSHMMEYIRKRNKFI